ncbi:unnamed protein product [Effrenium voratum]|nr:unnamed protein product [Effrenium voratum]
MSDDVWRPRFGKLDGYLSPSQNLKFAEVPSGLAAISKVPLEGWLQILLVAGLIETQLFKDQSFGGFGYAKYGEPGNFGTGYWGRKIQDPAERKLKLTTELNNGVPRLPKLVAEPVETGLEEGRRGGAPYAPQRKAYFGPVHFGGFLGLAFGLLGGLRLRWVRFLILLYGILLVFSFGAFALVCWKLVCPMTAVTAKDFCVSWNGDAHQWPDYVRKVRLQYEKTALEKRYLLGPELVSRLTDRAWEACFEIDHGRLQGQHGAKFLLTHLRDRLCRAPVPDAGARLEDLLIRLRRTPGTPFSQWAHQVRETYRRLQRALVRAREEYDEKRGKAADRHLLFPSTRPRRASMETQSEPEPPSADTSRDIGSPAKSTHSAPADGQRDEAGDLEGEIHEITWEGEDGKWTEADWQKWREMESKNQILMICPGMSWKWIRWRCCPTRSLDGCFSDELVSLRVLVCPYKQRSETPCASRKWSALYAIKKKNFFKLKLGHVNDADHNEWNEPELTSEEQKQVDEAYAAYEDKVRTFVQARTLMKDKAMVVISGWEVPDLPEEDDEDGHGYESYADEVETVHAEAWTVQEAGHRCYAVLDSGATETVTSLTALTEIMNYRKELFGDEDVKVYPADGKSFRFGNGRTMLASSFVEIPQFLNGQKVWLGAYTLDTEDAFVPMLIGMRTLQKLEAVVDFRSRLTIFPTLSPDMITLHQCPRTGHLMIDLSADWARTSAHMALLADSGVQEGSVEFEPVQVATDGHVGVEGQLDEDAHDPAARIKRLFASRPSENPESNGHGPGNKQINKDVLNGQQETLSTCSTSASKKGKGKGKKANKLSEDQIYDMDRKEGPDTRDPRWEGGPCAGKHQPAPMGRGSPSGKNGWAKWTTCSVCRLRLEYIPAFGAHGRYRSAGPLGQDVKDQLEEKPNEIASNPATLSTTTEFDEEVGDDPQAEGSQFEEQAATKKMQKRNTDMTAEELEEHESLAKLEQTEKEELDEWDKVQK